ncbi:Transmembrane 7 superfamily member 3 [Chionoecetes opilio]|uniref:Transmembrane 7 superfamily member 3 n=1 Tax=Chionoecetes opilio TaxID=41210 RepID=A0A8J4YN25_CHIOP|nr:Transmembrane 7 superfamily member 3 [Chionoecetes opilio]
MVHHYTNRDPIPGKYKAPCVPLPFLVMDPNILTTEVSYQAAAMAGWDSEDVVGALRYEVFLTYMYARDLSEEKYWDTLVATSSLQGLKENGKSVLVRENNDTAEELDVWLVSYSGVGAVVTVVVSYNGSNGTLYSSGVSYGCNFIDAEKYRCTKLVTSLAKLFCASLLFIGAIMLFLGHRWLNFTMFISGFLFSWCMLFLVFAQSTHSTINGLGWGTLVGAVLGGALWLVGWHRFRRPFHSSLLLIIMAVLFVGMMATYFLRYSRFPVAISPTTSNLSAFVVFPVFFAIVIVAYSIIDIKKVHIFSCTLLGSYAFIVPFAFYFGSSLTYIVINVLGLVTVQHYAETVGYPPFQVCDIILLCLWVGLFGGGMAYQLYRERASPPFHPPNLTSWHDFKKSVNFVFDKMFACLPMDPDPGGMDVEDRPAWLLRVVYTSKLAWRRLTCRGGDIPQSGYESFPRIRRLSQYNDQDSNTSDSRMAMILSRIKAWKGRVWLYFRRGNEECLRIVMMRSSREERWKGRRMRVSCWKARRPAVPSGTPTWCWTMLTQPIHNLKGSISVSTHRLRMRVIQ